MALDDTPPALTGGRLRYQPALDGVRAVAVAMVLVFHAGFGWMSGGYVGVSVFFTLSGFLITSLALAEHSVTGRIDVGAFYARRLRRLMPAALACLVGVVVINTVGLFGDVAHLRRDLWAALAQIYNWIALGSETTYEEQVAAAAGRLAPLDHFWSLAIEEQFYWIWPIVLALTLPSVRSPRARIGAILAATAVAATAAPLTARWFGGAAAYWATPARIGEILVGAALAVTLRERPGTRVPTGRRERALGWMGISAVGVIGWAAVTWPVSGGPAAAGWFPVFALASAALIASVQVDSPLRRVLSWRPLVLLGAISYGVYLYHWPVYALIDQTRLDIARPLLFGVRLSVTLALAVVSYRWLERPVRRAGWSWRPVAKVALVAGASMALVVALAVPADPEPYWVASSAIPPSAQLEPSGDGAAPASPIGKVVRSPVASPSAEISAARGRTPTTERGRRVRPVPPAVRRPRSAPRPVRVLVVGDSTAMATANGLLAWAGAHPAEVSVGVHWSPGCGFYRRGEVPGRSRQFESWCVDFHEAIPQAVAESDAHVVMLMATVGDLDRRVLDGDRAVGPGDAPFERVMAAEYEGFLARLRALGVERVAWVVPPAPATVNSRPADYDVLRRHIERVAADHPDVVAVVDLDGWGPAHDGRPDGLHYTPEAAAILAEEFLVPELLRIADS